MEKKVITSLILSSLVGAVLLLLPSKVRAQSASLTFSPASQSVGINQTFSVAIMINTGGVAVNGVTADFTFPSARLEVVSIDSSSSVFNLTAEENHASGVVYISRAVSGGGSYNGSGEVVTVNFRSTATGSSTLAFTDDAAVTDAGTSSDVLGTTGTGTVSAGSLPATGLSDQKEAMLIMLAMIVGVIVINLGLIGQIQHLNKNKLLESKNEAVS